MKFFYNNPLDSRLTGEGGLNLAHLLVPVLKIGVPLLIVTLAIVL